MRLGEAVIAAETARLWVENAADVAEDERGSPERIVAYVNLARLAVERAALDVLEIVHRSVGLARSCARIPWNGSPATSPPTCGSPRRTGRSPAPPPT